MTSRQPFEREDDIIVHVHHVALVYIGALTPGILAVGGSVQARLGRWPVITGFSVLEAGFGDAASKTG